MMSKRGKMNLTEGFELPEGNIANIQNSNKYLMIMKMPQGIQHTAKYLLGVRQVLGSQLSGQNKIKALILCWYNNLAK